MDSPLGRGLWRGEDDSSPRREASGKALPQSGGIRRGSGSSSVICHPQPGGSTRPAHGALVCGTVHTQEDPVKYVRWHAVYTAGDPWRRQAVCGPQEPDGERTPQRLHRERPARPAVLRKLLAAAGITVGSRAPSPRTDPVSPAGAGRGGGVLDVGAVCRGGDGALPGPGVQPPSGRSRAVM